MKFTFPHLPPSLLAAAILLAGISTSEALSLSFGPAATGGTTTAHVWQTDYAAWVIADLTDPVVPDPVSVTHSATGGAWTLNLSFPAGFGTLQTGDVFDLQEIVTLGDGSIPIDRWQQTLLTPGWEWVQGGIFDDATASPLPGLHTSAGTSSLSFTFDPIGEGTSLLLAASLRYTGAPGAATPLAFQIAPVPEPGTALLGLLGSLVLNRRGRPQAR